MQIGNFATVRQVTTRQHGMCLVCLLACKQDSHMICSCLCSGHGLVMKIGDFGMSRQVIMRQDGMCLERAMSANVIGTAAYSAPELLLAASPVKQNRVDAATVLKSDVSFSGIDNKLHARRTRCREKDSHALFSQQG